MDIYSIDMFGIERLKSNESLLYWYLSFSIFWDVEHPSDVLIHIDKLRRNPLFISKAKKLLAIVF